MEIEADYPERTNFNVNSVLLYELETWKTTKACNFKNVQSFLNRYLRSIVSIHWLEVIRNEELCEGTGKKVLDILLQGTRRVGLAKLTENQPARRRNIQGKRS